MLLSFLFMSLGASALDARVLEGWNWVIDIM